MVPTSTRTHEHTNTRAHDTQPIPPQKNLTIRGSTSPAAAQKYVTNTHQDAPPPAPPHRKRRQWARSSRQHALRPDVPETPPRRKRLTPHHRAQTVVHYTPNTPCHPHSTEVDCTLSKHAGGFATIDPRHADDTPQSSAYGSNSPKPPTNTSHNTTTNRRRQAEHDQHCHIKDPPAHRRATTPPSTQPPRHTTTQAPTVSSIIPAAHTKKGRALPAAPQKTPHPTPPRQTHEDMSNTTNTATERARDASPSKQPRGGFCDHRPPTRRRHATKQRLW